MTRGDESALLQAVLINPVVASMDASHTSFQVTNVYMCGACTYINPYVHIMYIIMPREFKISISSF